MESPVCFFMNNLEEIFFAASIDQDISAIDLHGIANPARAIEQLESQLFLLFQNKVKYCRVVHGIGAGVLARAVHGVLGKNPMVHGWKEEESGGSCVVVF